MKVIPLCPTLCDPMDCSLPSSSVHGILQARMLEWVVIPFSRGSSNPGIKPRSPALQADSLLSEPPGKPKNTGVGSPSLLQGIFETQESNWGLLHGRQILYELNYQGSEVKSLGRLRLFATFPGNSTGVDCHFLLQGIFPTQGSNPGLPHCRQILYLSEPPGKPNVKRYYSYMNYIKRYY